MSPHNPPTCLWQTKLKRDLLNDGVRLSDDPINGVVYAGYDRCVTSWLVFECLQSGCGHKALTYSL